MSANIGSAGKLLFNTYSTVRTIKNAEYNKEVSQQVKESALWVKNPPFEEYEENMLADPDYIQFVHNVANAMSNYKTYPKEVIDLALKYRPKGVSKRKYTRTVQQAVMDAHDLLVKNRVMQSRAMGYPYSDLQTKESAFWQRQPTFEEYEKSQQANPNYVTLVHDISNAIQNYKTYPYEIKKYLLRYPTQGVSRRKYKKVVNQAVSDALEAFKNKRITESRVKDNPYLHQQHQTSLNNQGSTNYNLKLSAFQRNFGTPEPMNRKQLEATLALQKAMQNWKDERAILELQSDLISHMPGNNPYRAEYVNNVSEMMNLIDRSRIGESYPFMNIYRRPTIQDRKPVKLNPNMFKSSAWFPEHSEHYKTAGRLLFDTYLTTKLVKNAGNNGQLVDRAKGIWSKWNKTVVNYSSIN